LKTIHLTQQGSVTSLRLHRPRAGNRVNLAMAEDLALAAAQISQDDACRVVTLAGNGDVFSVGWELPWRSSSHRPLPLAAASIAALQQPVIVVLNGDAIGQGLELALAGDLRIAVATARFAMPQVQHGLLPWDGGVQRLLRLVGRAHALDLLLTASEIDAATALRMGLVNRVAAPGDLQEVVDQVVGSVLAGAPIAARYAKEAVTLGGDMTLAQGLRLEADLSMLLHSTKDRDEGIRSFLERRSPHFRGE